MPVLSNISNERKLFTSIIDLGKLSLLVSSKLNISAVPCVVPCKPHLLSPTAKMYVYLVTKHSVSTYLSISIPTASKPPVATPQAFDDSIAPPAINDLIATAVAKSSAPVVSDPTAFSDFTASTKPFVPTPFYHHQYKLDQLDALIQNTANQSPSSSTCGDFIRAVRQKRHLHPNIAHIPHPAAHLLSLFQKVGNPTIMSGEPWSDRQIESALKRGPHSSFKHESIFFEMNSQIWLTNNNGLFSLPIWSRKCLKCILVQLV